MDGLPNLPNWGEEENRVPHRSEVEAHLGRVLDSHTFSTSGRLKQLLTYLVQHKLEQPTRRNTEKEIAYEVFGKEDFDYTSDTSVRVAMLRLRTKLDQYYAHEGQDDALIIRFQGYEPVFSRPAVPPMIPEKSLPDTPAPIRRFRTPWKGFTAALALLVCIFGARYITHGWALHRQESLPASAETLPARFLAHSTSEGQSLHIIAPERQYGLLLMTPDGSELYAVESVGARSVTAFGVADLKQKFSFILPGSVRSAFMSRDGKRIYFGSAQDGVIVFNAASGRLERTIPTGGPVPSLAVSPDNRKLFVAMGIHGVKRIDLRTGDVRVLSSVAYPEAVSLDRTGRNVYVSYQHGGPGGSPGHDVIEVYSVAAENVSYVIKDLPMVGAKALFAPSDEVVLLDMRDACLSSYYDHVGCPAAPSGGFHLWRPADRRVIATLPFPPPGEIGGFLPQGTRIFFTGAELEVWDWARRQVLEKMKPPEAIDDGEIASSRSRIFLRRKAGGLVVLDAEKPECQPPALGLENFYPGDGSLDDARGTGKLAPRGHIRFAPGRIGQAFDFNGSGGRLQAEEASTYCPFCGPSWTESFFVKFHSIRGEMVVLESPTTSYGAGRRIVKTAGNHFSLEVGGGPYPKVVLNSRISIAADRWYHLTVATNHDRKCLFVNGVLQGERLVPVGSPSGDHTPVVFGSDRYGRHALDGLLDEILVYDRALKPAEVKKIAQSCVAP